MSKSRLLSKLAKHHPFSTVLHYCHQQTNNSILFKMLRKYHPPEWAKTLKSIPEEKIQVRLNKNQYS
jgi:tRNA A37 methylthiotransferase MiaB